MTIHNRFEYLYELTSEQFKIIGNVITKFMVPKKNQITTKYVYNIAPVLQENQKLNLMQTFKIVSDNPIYNDYQQVILEHQQKRKNRFLTKSIKLRFEQVKQLIYFKDHKNGDISHFSNRLLKDDFVIKSGYSYKKLDYVAIDDPNLIVSFAYDFTDLLNEKQVSTSRYLMAIKSFEALPVWLTHLLKLVVKDTVVAT